ncbi:ANTAR domain-containing protein [Streptomyces sp. NPDC047869]|uniref:ANTAR domain-containing protein n=1 Tax=Streptomyces sp. NPDC047869 TaxID=3154709 RepID=UPI003452937E
MRGHDEQADRLTALQEEVSQLRHAVVSHAVIDQAIGVVVAVGGVSAGQGWEVLRRISQHTNTKLREVARCLVEWPASGLLPEPIDRALGEAVERVRDATALAPADGYDAWAVRCGSPE